MERCVQGSKEYQCMRCGKDSRYGALKGQCQCHAWLELGYHANRKYADQLLGGHDLQKRVDEDGRNTSCCRNCGGYSTRESGTYYYKNVLQNTCSEVRRRNKSPTRHMQKPIRGGTVRCTTKIDYFFKKNPRQALPCCCVVDGEVWKNNRETQS